MFGSKQADAIVNQFNTINRSEALDPIIGGEVISGQHNMLFNCIIKLKQAAGYQDSQQKPQKALEDEEERRKKVKRDNAACYHANASAQMEQSHGVAGSVAQNSTNVP
jgi:hypothetical protein